jgi:hypothetical protein
MWLLQVHYRVSGSLGGLSRCGAQVMEGCNEPTLVRTGFAHCNLHSEQGDVGMPRRVQTNGGRFHLSTYRRGKAVRTTGATAPHPEQGYRVCLGLLHLSREYGEGCLEAASALAVPLGSPTRKSVKSILESGRDLRQTAPLDLELPPHGDVRSPGYYH